MPWTSQQIQHEEEVSAKRKGGTWEHEEPPQRQMRKAHREEGSGQASCYQDQGRGGLRSTNLQVMQHGGH